MTRWETFRAIAPHVFFSCFVLLVSILLPLCALLASLGIDLTEIKFFVFALNHERRICDMMLILLPICVGYTLMGVLFAYNTGRSERDIPPELFIPVFILPIVGLFISEVPLYFYLLKEKDISLSDNHYLVASSAIYLAITCCVLMELFMSIARVSTVVSARRSVPPPPQGAPPAQTQQAS